MNKFKSFLNDEKAVKKVLIFLTPFLLALIIFAGVKLGSTIKSDEPVPEPVESEITEQATKNEPPTEDDEFFDEPEDEEKYMLDLPTEFVPFKCSGKYYSFGEPKNQYGYSFKTQYVKDYSLDLGGIYKIVYIHNNEEMVLFETEKPVTGIHVSAPAYIDDNLFISVHQNETDTLYRIALEYNADGNIKSHEIYFVAKSVNRPVKAMNNALIIEQGYYGEYVSLNTKTGEISPVEYSNEVDPSSVKVSVSSNAAIKIAEKELEKDKYKNVYENEYNYIPDIDFPNPVLIHNPNIIYHKGYEDYIYEDYPEYVWIVRYNSEPLYQNVRIYVNATSGEISYVQIQPYP